ncbi:MAG: hypothetical protein H6841_02105 [Planctomycetes bacterium]|nr:hypothetical protein [Planctomycetota bacterium]MCB9935147.1 hypothetical protein [Planctomycetota bacterium]
MKRILLAGVAAIALSAMFVSPVVADKVEGGKVTLVAEGVPAPDALKINAGVKEGHKAPLEVYKKALKAAKAGEMETLKACFNPNNIDGIDSQSWDSDGDEELTNLGSMAKVLKGYSEDGAERAQGSVGDYAIIAVKNGEAVNLVKCVRVAKWTDDGEEKDKNWYLSSYYANEYRIDYNAPGVKEIRDAIEKGDVAKLKEHLDEYQTQVLDLITEEGTDGYALLLKSLKGIAAPDAKPAIILSRSDNALAYWFHSDKGDKFLVLRFMETYDWKTEKKYTQVNVEVSYTSQFKKDAGETFKNFVADWSW